ncbi:hypothetical protein DFJ63DRAFT_310653 [Scheffersomyces coipomensis]|uniref:uncharacterized protein n=1 Tax=Scheffersomyces coipomensis TaxID=1788519 RepID=UPI00315CEFFF
MSPRTMRPIRNAKSPVKFQSLSPKKYPSVMNFKIPESSAFTINSPPSGNKENVNNCESPIKRKPLIERFKTGDEFISKSSVQDKVDKNLDELEDDEFDAEQDDISQPTIIKGESINNKLGRIFEDIDPPHSTINRDTIFDEDDGESFVDNIFQAISDRNAGKADFQKALLKYTELNHKVKIDKKLTELISLTDDLNLSELQIKPIDTSYDESNIEEKYFQLLAKYEDLKDQIVHAQDTVSKFKETHLSMIYHIKHFVFSPPSKTDETIVPNTKINLFEQLVFGDLFEDIELEETEKV